MGGVIRVKPTLVTVMHDSEARFLKAFHVHMPKLKQIYHNCFLALSDQSDHRLEQIAKENGVTVIRVAKKKVLLLLEEKRCALHGVISNKTCPITIAI